MHKDKHIIAVIPARGGSKRLKYKNIYQVLGKPMLAWAIDACKGSQHIDEIYVASEDIKILTVAETHGAKLIKRPSELSEDHVFKMVPIRHAVQDILDNPQEKNPDVVIIVQANSPEIKTNDLDGAIQKLFEHNRQEIFSVDNNLNQNASFRVITREGVFQKELSTNCGVYITNEYDVHTKEDVEEVEKRIKK
mgnify:CR=1 FL=1